MNGKGIFRWGRQAIKLSPFAPVEVRQALASAPRQGGLAGLVLLPEGENYVIKVTGCIASSMMFQLQFQQNKPGLPRVLHLYGRVGIFDGGAGRVYDLYGFKLERLVPLQESHSSQLSTEVLLARARGLYAAGRPLNAVEVSLATIEQFRSYAVQDVVDALPVVAEAVRATEGRFDMFVSSNWMKTQSGCIVMADPLIQPPLWRRKKLSDWPCGIVRPLRHEIGD